MKEVILIHLFIYFILFMIISRNHEHVQKTDIINWYYFGKGMVNVCKENVWQLFKISPPVTEVNKFNESVRHIYIPCNIQKIEILYQVNQFTHQGNITFSIFTNCFGKENVNIFTYIGKSIYLVKNLKIGLSKKSF